MLSPLNNSNVVTLYVTRPNLIYNRKKAICTFISIWFFFALLLNDGKTTSIIRLSTSCSLFCFLIFCAGFFFCVIIGALTIQCLTIFHLDRLSLSGMIVLVTLVSVFIVRLIAFDQRFLSAFFVHGLVYIFIIHL